MTAGFLLAAPDKFRGTARASDVAGAVVEAARRAGWAALARPLSDGGEGLLDVLGGEERRDVVEGPGGSPVRARWTLREGTPRTAVIEMAEASGLALVGGPERNDPVHASTRGTGELVCRAVESGATRIIVGCGGSATTDGGAGALEILGGPGALRGVTLEIVCDVRTRFVDAARVFGPQKGADAHEVEFLERRLRRCAADYRRRFGVDVGMLEGAGAGGGLAGGLAAIGGTIFSGYALVARRCGLHSLLDDARLVVTGEGSLDATSLEGKVVSGVVADVAGRVPVLVVAGRASLGAGELARACGVEGSHLEVVSLTGRFGEERARRDTLASVGEVVSGWLADLAAGDRTHARRPLRPTGP